MGRFPCDGTKLFPIEIENVITWCNLVATREIQAGHWEKLSHCTCCSEKLWNPFLCSFQDSWTKLADLLWGWWLSCFRQLAELDDPGRLLPPNTYNTAHLQRPSWMPWGNKRNSICRSVRGTEVFEPAPYLWNLWDYEFIFN